MVNHWRLGDGAEIIPNRLRRFILPIAWRMPEIGCHSRYRLEAHHVIPWSDGGPTNPENLVTLCWFHHHVVVHGFGYRIDPRLGPGRVRFIKPGPDPHPEVPVESTLRTLKQMETGLTISTERLVLRRWSIDDRAELAALNSDPEVMEHFPGVLTAEESFRMVQRIEPFRRIRLRVVGGQHDLGAETHRVLRSRRPNLRTRFTPAVEIGWRFARNEWGNGCITEAGRAPWPLASIRRVSRRSSVGRFR